MERDLQRSAEHARNGPGPLAAPTQVEKKARHTGEPPGERWAVPREQRTRPGDVYG